MNYHHLYEMVTFQNPSHALFKSFFSDGVINPSSIFFSMKFPFVSYLHCICGIVYMSTRRCPDLCPLTPPFSWYMTSFYSLPIEYTSLCSPPPPFHLPKKFPLWFTRSSLLIFLASLERLCPFGNLLQASLALSLLCFQHLSPSRITISLWTGSAYFYLFLQFLSRSLAYSRSSIHTHEWINKWMNGINEEHTKWEGMEIP